MGSERNRCISIMGATATGKSAAAIELAEDLPTIHGNANQLQQVLMNLIMNAQQSV